MMSRSRTGGPNWNAILAPYKKPESRRAVVQLVDTALPLAALWLVMLWSLRVSYWLTLVLAIPTALLVVRMFMFQHDCGHGAFFPSQRVNNVVGGLIGVLTLVPYSYWRKTHAIHHAEAGNLDGRGYGDVDTLTVREYLSLSRAKQLLYRLYRNPVVLLVIGPIYQFILKHRLPADAPRAWKREWSSVHKTNAAIVAVIAVMWLVVGLDRFLLVQLPITLIAGTVGIYLFYVQHQFGDTYWRYREEWDYYAAGLEGASHLVMPKVMQWFTASIGLHHIHHVSSRIPNYHLQRCYDEIPECRQATQLRLLGSARTLRLTLWDEDSQQLVGFRDLERIRPQLEAHGPVRPTKAEAVPKSWR